MDIKKIKKGKSLRESALPFESAIDRDVRKFRSEFRSEKKQRVVHQIALWKRRYKQSFGVSPSDEDVAQHQKFLEEEAEKY